MAISIPAVGTAGQGHNIKSCQKCGISAGEVDLPVNTRAETERQKAYGKLTQRQLLDLRSCR